MPVSLTEAPAAWLPASPATRRDEPARPAADDRHNGQPGADREDEGPLLELSEPAVAAPSSLGEDDDRVTGARSVERRHGLLRVLALDRDHAERIEDGSDHRMAPELPLGGEACPARQEAEEDEDVEEALMVRRDDERTAARQVRDKPHVHAHAEHPGE